MQQSSAPSARQALLLSAVLLGALAARLPALAQTPLFYDESVYLDRALSFPAKLLQTIGDGKLIQELALALLMSVPVNPLLQARMLSIVCGLATIVLLWRIGARLGQPQGGLLAAVLYAGAPLAALHDALAIPDSMLALVVTAVLAACVHFASRQAPGRREAALVGGCIGLAALVKLPGLLMLAWPILAVVLLAPDRATRRQQAAMLPTIVIVPFACVAMLAPLHYGGAEQSKMSGDWLAARIGNVAPMLDWLARYLPLPILLGPLALLATRTGTPLQRRYVWWLTLAGMSIPAAFLVLGATLVPRYILPAWPPLMLACGLALAILWQTYTRRGLVAVVLTLALAWDIASAAALARDPVANLLAEADRRQYYQNWTAGYGAGDLVAALRSQAARTGGLTLVEHDQPRLVHNIGRIYLRGDPRVTIEQVDLRAPGAPAQLDALARRGPAFLAVDAQEYQAFEIASRFPHLQPVGQFPNPYSDQVMYLYAIGPE
jgi:hypothetical protein